MIALVPFASGRGHDEETPPSAVESFHQRVTLPARSADAINIANFGAVGDGQHDDTAALKQAIAATPPGGTVWLPSPPVAYLIGETVSLRAPVTLLGDNTAINFVGNRPVFLSIETSNITIAGLHITGQKQGRAISAEGSNQAWLTNLTITGNTIEHWHSGLVVSFVDDFRVQSNTIDGIRYVGISTYPGRNGTIEHNIVRNIASVDGNGYGISAGYNYEAQVPSKFITIHSNLVEHSPVWECLDTHGGDSITITGNTVRDCRVGIWVGPATNVAVAPQSVLVAGNTVQSTVTNGSHGPGIVIAGAFDNTGQHTQTAIGVVVRDNQVIGHGTETTYGSAAIVIRGTDSATVFGNTVDAPSPIGILADQYNSNLSIEGNSISGPWSRTKEQAAAVFIAGPQQTVHIAQNRFLRGTQAAPYVLRIGIYVLADPSISVTIDANQSEAAIAVMDSGKRVR